MARKFFVEDIKKGKIEYGSDYNHIVNVLRKKENDFINIFDNKGKDYECQIMQITKKYIEYEVTKIKENFKQNSSKISLFISCIKPENLELIVQKCTELNVDNIYIFSSEFSNYKPSQLKLEKLNKISIEACKQCERSESIKIFLVNSFDEMLQKIKDFDLIVFAYEKSEISFKQIFSNQKNVAILVGPEGGFSQKEVEEIESNDKVKEVSISKNILRSETASIFLCSVCMYELN